MDEKELKILRKFYNSLCDAIRRILKKSTKNNSPIIIFFGLSIKKVHQTLQKCSIPSFQFNKDELSFYRLFDKKYIMEGEKSGEYIITPKGIWEYEKNIEKFGLNNFLDYIDKKYFSSLLKGQEKPLNPKEKIIIFSMIAVRSLSKGHSMDLSDEKNLSNYWTEIFNKTRDFLLKLRVITQIDYEEFWKEREDEVIGAIQYLMSRINKLPSKTKNIYHNPGRRKYYLEIPKNFDLIKINLKFLLNKVFNRIELNESQKEEILDFIKEISFDYSIYIFENFFK